MRMAMMAITTSSSISVNAGRRAGDGGRERIETVLSAGSGKRVLLRLAGGTRGASARRVPARMLGAEASVPDPRQAGLLADGPRADRVVPPAAPERPSRGRRN